MTTDNLMSIITVTNASAVGRQYLCFSRNHLYALSIGAREGVRRKCGDKGHGYDDDKRGDLPDRRASAPNECSHLAQVALLQVFQVLAQKCLEEGHLKHTAERMHHQPSFSPSQVQCTGSRSNSNFNHDDNDDIQDDNDNGNNNEMTTSQRTIATNPIRTVLTISTMTTMTAMTKKTMPASPFALLYRDSQRYVSI